MDETNADWVVHVIGADDVFTQRDELTALREANKINKVISQERQPGDPFCVALVKNRAVEEV